MPVKVCLGGTFSPLHAGHRALLAAAAKEATHLFVGITRGGLARRTRDVPPWEERAKHVEEALALLGYAGELVLRPLEDGVGPAVSGDFEAIVASPETLQGAERINLSRIELGKPPLRILQVAHVLAQDLLPISGTRIAAGDIDTQGRRLTKVRIAVGSANGVKVRAVEQELGLLLKLPLEATGHAAASGVPEQPRGVEVLQGARNRARAAHEAQPGCDYAVGVEAGLVWMPGDEVPVDVQACVVLDPSGAETHGWGPGFQYPAWVTERALRGEMVSSILGPIANDSRIGSTTGAIGYLSDGRLDRTALTQQAVLMAMVPRVRRALYVGPPPA